jgi:hypothetical protein
MTTLGMSEMNIKRSPLTMKMVHGTNCTMMDIQNMVYSHCLSNFLMQGKEEDRTLWKIKGF